MDDLISRRAAIDKAQEIIGYEAGFKAWAILDALRQLPSVVPSYADEQIQKMQELEQAQIEKAFELGREDAKSEIIHCKYCKHRILNENYGKKGYLKEIKAICELDSGDPFELGRNADDDEWYCADAERRTESE